MLSFATDNIHTSIRTITRFFGIYGANFRKWSLIFASLLRQWMGGGGESAPKGLTLAKLQRWDI